jgi:tetratricopeptide (TPR) repeat protein
VGGVGIVALDSLGLTLGPSLRGIRGVILTFAGRVAEAVAEIRTAIALMEKTRAAESLVYAEGWLALAFWAAGDAEAALAHAREAVMLATRLGVHHGSVMAYLSLGMAYAAGGAWRDGVDALEHSLATARARHAGLDLECQTLCVLSICHLALDEIDVARARAEEARELAAARGECDMEVWAELTLARALIRNEGTAARARVEQTVQSALGRIRESGALGLEPGIHETRAELAAVLGDDAARRAALREAHRIYQRMGAHGHAARLARELGA